MRTGSRRQQQGTQTTEAPNNPNYEDIYCVDIRRENGTWVQIESRHEDSDTIILNFINELVDSHENFNGNTVRFYTLDEMNEIRALDDTDSSLETLRTTCVTVSERNAIITAKERTFGTHPDDVEINVCD